MKLDLSFWRFVIILSVAKSGLWQKADDWFHVGTFGRNNDTAFKIIVLPFSLMLGFAKPVTQK
jgi:hypothetical protein